MEFPVDGGVVRVVGGDGDHPQTPVGAPLVGGGAPGRGLHEQEGGVLGAADGVVGEAVVGSVGVALDERQRERSEGEGEEWIERDRARGKGVLVLA